MVGLHRASVKEIWDKLVVTYGGRSQVKEIMINILMDQYDMFKMKKDENINKIFTFFTLVTNSLNSLGKSFSNAKKVQEVLRRLPRCKWGPKVTDIEETQDLRVLSLDDLLGKLTTHEPTLHDDEESDIIPSMKNLALKAKKRKEFSSKNEESHDEEDSFALITRDQEGIMKMRKRFKRYKSRNDYKHKSSSSSNSKSIKLACFECRSTEHVMKECPKKKKEHYKKNKKKQAMAAKCSDSKGSSESENKDRQAHLCLMVNSDKEDEEEDNSKEVFDFLNSCSNYELVKTLFDMFQN